MKLITIVAGCFNEEGNVEEFYARVKKTFEQLSDYEFEIIFIDNDSRDNTQTVLRRLAEIDSRVKVVLNTRNFGAVRSGFYAFLLGMGDAVMPMASDLQDPPELIPQFIEQWEAGKKVVIGVKRQSEESSIMFAVRKIYYQLITTLSEIPLVQNFTGYGLYDQSVLQILRTIHDPYPYFRGLICDLGFERGVVYFTQPKRAHGRSSYNLYSLYDYAMLGITNHSKVPLRIATFSGFCLAALSLAVAAIYLIYKLLYWNSFNVGTAPATIGLFFFSAVQLICLGIMGEYVGSVHTQVMKRPLVVEKERINF